MNRVKVSLRSAFSSGLFGIEQHFVQLFSGLDHVFQAKIRRYSLPACLPHPSCQLRVAQQMDYSLGEVFDIVRRHKYRGFSLFHQVSDAPNPRSDDVQVEEEEIPGEDDVFCC